MERLSDGRLCWLCQLRLRVYQVNARLEACGDISLRERKELCGKSYVGRVPFEDVSIELL